MKRRIELLESVANANKMIITELRRNLDQEKEISQQRLEENNKMKEELVILQQKWKESCYENQQYQDKINYLSSELDLAQKRLKEVPEKRTESHEERQNNSGSGDSVSLNQSLVNYDQLVNLEEELVLMKERFAQVSEDKLKLQRDLLTLTAQYNLACNRSHTKYFFYVAPLVFMVLYLLVSAMIS